MNCGNAWRHIELPLSSGIFFIVAYNFLLFKQKNYAILFGSSMRAWWNWQTRRI